jgi:ribosomal protein S12 methylthiotransferase accessory factor
MEIYFDGNKRVNARYNGNIIKTDQPLEAGGDSSAPAPFDLFLASIGTCAGFYVKSFCDQRGIDADNIKIIQEMKYDLTRKMISKVNIIIQLPADFPQKYKDAVVNAANLCAVKKHLISAPDLEVSSKIG